MARRPHKQAAQAPAAAMPSERPAAPALVKLVFTRAHRHAGTEYQAGEGITVDADTAALLRHFGVVEG